jgi:hypothetical protein
VQWPIRINPGVETPGYFHRSLRDEDFPRGVMIFPGISAVPAGLVQWPIRINPGVETPGYFHRSLRDDDFPRDISRPFGTCVIANPNLSRR